MNPFSTLLYVFASLCAVVAAQLVFGSLAPETDAAAALLAPLTLTAAFCFAVLAIEPRD